MYYFSKMAATNKHGSRPPHIPSGMRRNAPYIETNRRQLQGNGTYEGFFKKFMRMREEMMRHVEDMVYRSMQGRRM